MSNACGVRVHELLLLFGKRIGGRSTSKQHLAPPPSSSTLLDLQKRCTAVLFLPLGEELNSAAVVLQERVVRIFRLISRAVDPFPSQLYLAVSFPSPVLIPRVVVAESSLRTQG